LIGRTNQRSAWRAPLAVIRALNDLQLLEEDLPFFDYEDKTLCFRLDGLRATSHPGNYYEWNFRMQFALRDGAVVHTSEIVTLGGVGLNFNDAWMKGGIVPFYSRFQAEVGQALVASQVRLVDLAKTRLATLVKMGGALPGAMDTEFRAQLFSEGYQAESQMAELVNDVELSRLILRAYLALNLPEYFRRHDSLRMFLEFDAKDGTSSISASALQDLGTGYRVKFCGKRFAGHGNYGKLADLFEACKQQWASHVALDVPFPKEQWRYHFDLYRSSLILRELYEQLQ
jgi:hypothetical protein